MRYWVGMLAIRSNLPDQSVSAWAVVSREPSGKILCAVFADSRERLDFLIGTLRADLEYTVIPKDLFGELSDEEMGRLPWVLPSNRLGCDQAMRPKPRQQRIQLRDS